MKHYGVLAKPLTDLLKKEMFEWSPRAHESFDTLKAAMSSTPVVALPDFTKQFIVEADASSFGVGAVLMQNNKPIAYFIHSLLATEQLKTIYERELMAVVFAIRKWKHYFLGRRFRVHTDQKSIKFLLEQREVNMEYRKWLIKLMGYDFEIIYKHIIDNKAADGLSRMFDKEDQDISSSLLRLTVREAIQLQDLYAEMENVEQIRQWLKQVESGQCEKKGLLL